MRYTEEIFQSDNKLLAGVEGLRSPVHVTLDETKISPDADGRKYRDGGFWVAVAADGMGRALPRSKATAAIATTDTAIQLSDVQAFIPGDDVYIVPASAQIELGAAWAAGNTLTVTIAGLDYTYTVAATLTGAQMAEAFATAFNSNPQTRGIAQAIAGGEAVTITAKDFVTPHTIAIAAVGGTATIADGLTALIPFRQVGTIGTNGVDVAGKTLTLTATSAVTAAIGVPIGTADEVVGIHLRGHDFREDEEENGVYTSLSGKRGAFPYLDGGLEARFVEIQAVGA